MTVCSISGVIRSHVRAYVSEVHELFLHEPITIGLLFRDGTSGRMHMGALRYENAAFELLTTRYADPQTKDGDDTPVKNIADWMEPWLRIEDDGTNLRFLYSADGDNWVLVNEELRTAWLANLDQVGIYFQGRNFVSATDDLVAKILLWEVT